MIDSEETSFFAPLTVGVFNLIVLVFGFIVFCVWNEKKSFTAGWWLNSKEFQQSSIQRRVERMRSVKTSQIIKEWQRQIEGSESARKTKRQSEGEQHGGIISDSLQGLKRNAEVWHTRMWWHYGLVSLFSLHFLWPVLQVHISYLPIYVHFCHLPLNFSLCPSDTLSNSYLTQLTSPSHTSQCSVFSTIGTWSNFYGFSTLDAAAEQIQCFFSSWLETTSTVFFPNEVVVPQLTDTPTNRSVY